MAKSQDKLASAKEELSRLEKELDSDQLDERGTWRKAMDWYFEPRPFERDGRAYELVGVKKFKELWVDFMIKRFDKETHGWRDEEYLRTCIKILCNCGLKPAEFRFYELA